MPPSYTANNVNTAKFAFAVQDHQTNLRVPSCSSAGSSFLYASQMASAPYASRFEIASVSGFAALRRRSMHCVSASMPCRRDFLRQAVSQFLSTSATFGKHQHGCAG